MKFRVAMEQMAGQKVLEQKLSAATLIYHYLDQWGDVEVDGADWDYQVLIQEEHSTLRLSSYPIETPWTFRLTAANVADWDIAWREAGVTEIWRGKTMGLGGVQIEIERFLQIRRNALTVKSAERESARLKKLAKAGHVFISYVTEDSDLVDRLQGDLEEAGISVWRDRTSLGAGELWKNAIRTAIGSGSFFLACFSASSARRTKSYMNEELTVAVEELRARPRDRVWFLPTVLPGGSVPEWPVSAGESLRDFNYTSLAPERWGEGVRALILAVQYDPQ